MALFDTHAHLDDERFDGDREAVITAMAEAGMLCVTVGSDMESSAACVELAHRHAGLWAAVGVHPHEADGWDEEFIPALTDWAADDRVVALGEMGLDYHYDFSSRDAQRRALARQMELAAALNLPAIFHVREAWGDFLPLLGKNMNGVMHCYSGSVESAKICLDAGLYISFSGTVTYKNARNLKEAARYVPLNRLLIETDSPYLAPEPVRGRRNDPRNVAHTAAHIAELRSMPVEELARITLKNGCRLFGISHPDQT